MTLKKQVKTLKENWLLLAVVVVLFFAFSGGSISPMLTQKADFAAYGEPEMARSYATSSMMIADDGFAPEVTSRKLTTSSSLTTEVDRGEFYNAQRQLKDIVASSQGLILNENVQKYGYKSSHLQGSYSIKVPDTFYGAFLVQVKEIGEVESFSENVRDVTERYEDTQIELETEQARLERFQELYEEARSTEEKIQITDRIFNLERRIKYLQESIENQDQRIDYTTVHITIQEEQSEFAGVTFVTFSRLLRNIVTSTNSLLSLVFSAIPWLVVIGAGWFLWKRKR